MCVCVDEIIFPPNVYIWYNGSECTAYIIYYHTVFSTLEILFSTSKDGMVVTPGVNDIFLSKNYFIPTPHFTQFIFLLLIFSPSFYLYFRTFFNLPSPTWWARGQNLEYIALCDTPLWHVLTCVVQGCPVLEEFYCRVSSHTKLSSKTLVLSGVHLQTCTFCTFCTFWGVLIQYRGK